MSQRSAAGLLSVVAAAVLATGVGAEPAPELHIHAPQQLEAKAEQVRALQEDDFSAALVLTGEMGFRLPIQVILAPEDSDVARATPAWVSGFARGAEGVVVLFPGRVRSYPDNNLRTLLHHEVAHVMVARAAAGRTVPRWFNEGVATVAAREWGLEDRARYAMAVIGSRPHSTMELDAGFAGDGADLRRAYALSSAFVRFLQRRYGTFTPARILAGVAEGRSFDQAFLYATGVPLSRAEWIFFEREVVWNTWVPFLTSSGVLWMGITALALVAIIGRRRRNAAQRAAWDEEDNLLEQRARRTELRPVDDDETVN